MNPVKAEERVRLESIVLKVAQAKRLFRRHQNGQRKRIEPSTVKALNLAALKAIALVVTSNLKGGEIDIRIPLEGRKKTVPVSVLMDMSGRVTFEIAQRPTTMMYRNSWTPRYTSGDKPWTDRQKKALRIAVNQLSQTELKVLRHITLYRYRSAGKSKGALYFQNNCHAEIRIFDRSFESDRWTFSGSAYHPLSASTRTVLHEVGHAIHNRPGRYALCRFEKNQRGLQKRIERYNDLITRHKGRIPARLQARTKTERQAIRRDKSALEKEFKRAQSIFRKGPVLKAYERVLGDKEAPTQYGTTSLAESFAESFSLYRSDPKALKRLLPKVFEWFKGNGHMKAVGRTALGTLPRP